MKLTEVSFGRGLPIDGYGPGFFRVAGSVHRGAVLIAPEAALPWGGFADAAAVLALAGAIDVLFVGTGAEIAAIPATFRADPLEVRLVEEDAATLAALGLDLSVLSPGTLAVRGVPAALADADPASLARSVLSELREVGSSRAVTEQRVLHVGHPLKKVPIVADTH